MAPVAVVAKVAGAKVSDGRGPLPCAITLVTGDGVGAGAGAGAGAGVGEGAADGAVEELLPPQATRTTRAVTPTQRKEARLMLWTMKNVSEDLTLTCTCPRVPEMGTAVERPASNNYQSYRHPIRGRTTNHTIRPMPASAIPVRTKKLISYSTRAHQAATLVSRFDGSRIAMSNKPKTITSGIQRARVTRTVYRHRARRNGVALSGKRAEHRPSRFFPVSL